MDLSAARACRAQWSSDDHKKAKGHTFWGLRVPVRSSQVRSFFRSEGGAAPPPPRAKAPQ